MSDRADEEFVADIKEAIQRILLYTADVRYEGFISDIKTQDAVLRNLEILGEATKNISDEFSASHPSVPWKSMAGTRDRLIHHYFGVDLDIVWKIVTDELADVALQLQDI
jgi:uncharacterized protein with HEPN domain